MKGPKQFSTEEKMEIAASARTLEERAAEVNRELALCCDTLNAFTRGYFSEVQAYLAREGVRSDVVMMVGRVPISPMTPDIKLNLLLGISYGVQVSSDMAEKAVISKEQIDRLSYLAESYLRSIDRRDSQVKQAAIKQKELYEALLDLTIVEMPFTQSVLHESAVLHIPMLGNGNLVGVRADWKSEKYTRIPGPGIPIIDVTGSERLEKLQMDAGDSNVYIITPPSSLLSSQYVLNYVIHVLQNEYDRANPAVASQRQRKAAEMRVGDATGALRRFAEVTHHLVSTPARQRNRGVFKDAKGRRFGFTTGDVPKGMIDELMGEEQEEPASEAYRGNGGSSGKKWVQ